MGVTKGRLGTLSV
jgi:hypothetical protein